METKVDRRLKHQVQEEEDLGKGCRDISSLSSL